MLKVIFLGVNGSIQGEDSGNTSLLLLGKEGRAVGDLSCNIAMAVDADIDSVIFTHEHIDHVYGLPSLLHQLWICGRKKGLNIYVPKQMEAMINNLIDLFELRKKKQIFEIRICTEEVFNIGSLHVSTFPTDHTRASRGLVAEDERDKLVYTCDTRPIKEVPSVMRGAEVLIHEASGLSKSQESLVEKGHSSGLSAGILARKLEVKKLYLCHLPCDKLIKEAILEEGRRVFPETYIPTVCSEITMKSSTNIEPCPLD